MTVSSWGHHKGGISHELGTDLWVAIDETVILLTLSLHHY